MEKMKLVPKQKKPKNTRQADIVPVYFPDAKLNKLKSELEKVVSRHGKGMNYAEVIGVLEMIKHEELIQWKTSS